MYKYVPNSVVKISMMFAQYFEYYNIILVGAFFRGHAVLSKTGDHVHRMQHWVGKRLSEKGSISNAQKQPSFSVHRCAKLQHN